MMLKEGQRVKIWVMAAQESNAAFLFQLYVNYGRFTEATNLLLEFMESFASMDHASNIDVRLPDADGTCPSIKGDKIQASILNKSLFKLYEKDPVEGNCYFMANLEVIPNGKDYKVANHTFKLLFNPATYVKEEVAAIPLTGFNFLPIEDIITQTPHNHTKDLFDVIGFVLNIGPLEQYHSGPEDKKKIRIILGDNSNNTIQFILYDDCALKFSSNDFDAMEKPIVLVAHLARFGFDESAQPEICSSFHATKIYLNGKFNEVTEFLACAEKLPSPNISSLTPSLGTQSSTSAVHSILRNTPRIKVADMHNQEVDEHFAVVCAIKKFETRHGWVYEGCSRCGTKPKVVNGLVSCGSHYCKGKRCTIQSKLRLNYLISDDSGTASIVFFDKLASEILKKSAAELKADILAQFPHHNSEEEALRYEFPTEIDSLVGKKLILKMKLNKYNKEHPNSSISVATYAECADLFEEFNEAASQVGQPSGLFDDEEEETIFKRNATAEDKEPVNAETSLTLSDMFPTIDLEEVYISEEKTVVPSKGKRKVSSKKAGTLGSKSVAYAPTSPAKSSTKPLKSIKQEKI